MSITIKKLLYNDYEKINNTISFKDATKGFILD